MKFKCDHCDKPATIHLTEITGGQKIEKHLCENCAAGEGITVKANVPISQLLESFILQTTDSEGEASQAGQSRSVSSVIAANLWSPPETRFL